MNLRILFCCCALALAPATPAVAHVTVAPHPLRAGTVDEIVFRCPNERSNSSTVKLEIQLPPDHPLRMVSARPVPGWHVVVTKQTITWEGGAIHPGEYQDFAILAGPLPEGKLVFKALQTYASGEIVRWIQVPRAGEPEPPNPAPVLTVTR